MRSRPHLALLLSVTLSLGVVAAPSTAYAQTSSPETKLHFQRGVKLYSEEDYRGALVEFKRAYEVSQNYAILYNLGQTYFQLRDYANALTSFEKYLATGGAQINTSRKQDVDKDIEDLRGRVGKLTVESSVVGATVLLDDVAVGKTPLASAVTASAGIRKITLTKEGMASITKTVELAGGDKTTVSLEPPPTAPSTAGPGPRPPAPQSEGVSPLVFVGFGVAVAGVAVGTTFGILALKTKSDLDAVCTDKVCPTDSQSKGSTLTTQATVSTIGFGVGIVGAVVGTYFLLASGRSSEHAAARPRLTPWFAGTSGGVSGAF